MTLLEIKDLHKRFGDREILKGINLGVNQGEVVVVIGPSGSGKTTMLRSLNFLEAADSGTMRLADQEIDLARPPKSRVAWVRRHTAMVFQNYNLFKNKTALQNIAEGLIYGQGVARREAEERALAALKALGLADQRNHYPAQLSGGQQQRIGIARATVLKPEVILFDEPTSALDPELVGTVMNDMQRLAEQGQTMIVVTHQMWFARHVASRVVFFADGQIVEAGDPASLFDHPQEARTRHFLQSLAKNY